MKERLEGHVNVPTHYKSYQTYFHRDYNWFPGRFLVTCMHRYAFSLILLHVLFGFSGEWHSVRVPDTILNIHVVSNQNFEFDDIREMWTSSDRNEIVSKYQTKHDILHWFNPKTFELCSHIVYGIHNFSTRDKKYIVYIVLY